MSQYNGAEGNLMMPEASASTVFRKKNILPKKYFRRTLGTKAIVRTSLAMFVATKTGI